MITIGLKVDMPREELEGRVPLIIFGEPESKQELLDCALRVFAHIAEHKAELEFHKARMDEFGVQDKDVAASLLALLAGAEQALKDAATLEDFITALAELAPIGKAVRQ